MPPAQTNSLQLGLWSIASGLPHPLKKAIEQKTRGVSKSSLPSKMRAA